MSASFAPQLLSDEVRPLKIADRDAFVFPSYRKRQHEHADLTAVVTMGGKPIERGGETLLLGMVPMERRYAIGPVVDGRAEVMPDHLFKEENERIYVAEYGLRNQPPDNPKLRYVPYVVDFVAWKLDPTDPKRLTPLGYLPNRKTEEKPPSEAVIELENLRAEKDRQAIALDEMKRKLDELAAMVAAKPEPKPAPEPDPMDVAPCGKEVKPGFLSQHKRFCKKPECAPTTE